jgi:hypothetical protein
MNDHWPRAAVKPSDLLNRQPPAFCRFWARKNGGKKPMSHEDIARASGLSSARVRQISVLRTWENLPLRTIEAFAAACGVDLLRPGRIRKFAKQKRLVFLTRATHAQRKMYARLTAHT